MVGPGAIGRRARLPTEFGQVGLKAEAAPIVRHDIGAARSAHFARGASRAHAAWVGSSNKTRSPESIVTVVVVLRKREWGEYMFIVMPGRGHFKTDYIYIVM